MAPIALRPPTFSPAKQPAEHINPSIPWLSETWHVTHSTLPMWKSKRNVRIQYTPLAPTTSSIEQENTDRIDDLVTYQSLSNTKLQSLRGIDTCASANGQRGEWDWRGKGWLKIASSHWEILGWGEEEGTGNKWMVTEFAKTLFTPAGIDLYSKDRHGLKEETVENIKEALKRIEDEDVEQMASKLFQITMDDAREAATLE